MICIPRSVGAWASGLFGTRMRDAAWRLVASALRSAALCGVLTFALFAQAAQQEVQDSAASA